MTTFALLFVATAALTVFSNASPISEASASGRATGGEVSVGVPASSLPDGHPQRLQKRTVSKEPPTPEELAVLKDLILGRVASELNESMMRERTAASRNHAKEEDLEREEEEEMLAKAKRMFVPLSGLPGELPTIKRQIRYHQCYFNPISCFRRK